MPPPEFADLVGLFLTACNGLPASLKAMGALMCGEDNKCYWQEQLLRLKHTLPGEVFEILRISYESLHIEDQPVFLDIACFFLGEDIEKGNRIWGKAALKNLENRCLLEVDTQNKIKMHHHIRDMARNIANERTLPRRLWDSTTDIIDNLFKQPLKINEQVMLEVRGINMLSSSIDAFKDVAGLWNLQLVAFEGDHLEDILRRARKPHLIWLRWCRFSHSSLPDWIPMKNLKVLELAGRRLNTLWPLQYQGVPLNLRELNICAPLSEIPKSIGHLKYLQRIVICDDPYSPGALMKRLPDELCCLGSLNYLVIKGFSKMVLLPDSFGELTNLQHIDLEGASSLQTLPDSFRELTRLKHLSLRGCKSLIISSGTLGDITTLQYLNLSYCEHVKELPPQVRHQRCLRTLCVYGTKLNEFPSVGCNLKVLKLGGDLLETLLPGLRDLKLLETLSISYSPQLKSLPDSIGMLTQLTQLKISFCGIEYLPRSLVKMNILKSLEVRDCPLRELPFNKEVEGERETEGETALNKLNTPHEGCMFGLQRLELSRTQIRAVYFDGGICPNLQQLTLSGCSELRQIGGLCGLLKLSNLQISDCAEVEEVSGLETLTSLQTFYVWGCEKFPIISGQFTKLRRLPWDGYSSGVVTNLEESR